MKGLMPGRLAVALGALALAGTTLLTEPVQAQYGGYGGGGYDRPRRDSDDDYDRRRGPRSDYDSPRRGGGFDDGPRRGGGGGPQARGSFVQSCRDISQEGAYVSATCRMRGGGWRPSQIDARTCRSIGNNNGRLVCE